MHQKFIFLSKKMDSGHEKRKLVCLYLTDSEEELIQGIFRWNNIELVRASKDDHNKEYSSVACCEAAATADPSSPDQPPAPLAAALPGFGECPYCFCAPCIVDEANRQRWWPVQNAFPDTRNRKKRLETYKLFWAAMQNRDAWKDPRYQRKKREALQRDPHFSAYVWYHRRDIMPSCIVKQVRRWWPKEDSEEYVGHMWE